MRQWLKTLCLTTCILAFWGLGTAFTARIGSDHAAENRISGLVESASKLNAISESGEKDTFSGYYDPVAGLSGSALKAGLHNLLRSTHTTEFGYSNLETQMKITDEDPNNSNNVIEIYTGWSVPKSSYGGGTTDWNKEHTWSKSHGDFGDTAPAGTDLHHLRPCDATVNSFKNNRDFDEGANAYVDASPPSGYSGTTNCSFDDSNDFEPRDEDKGDVARMIFYMAVRYEGTDTSYDLELVDYTYSDAGTNEPLYGKLSTLLAWHAMDPPDAWEALRNNRIQSLQGNRNPFIDHPEWVASLWGGAAVPTFLNFYPYNASVNEADGSIDLTVVITDPSPLIATTADIILSSGSAADVQNYTTQSVSFPAGSSVSQAITVYLTNDYISEGTETLVFSLANVSGGTNASIGSNGSFSLQISDAVLGTPVAIAATAVSHEGFTARWNPVAGAQSYRLDVYSGASVQTSDLIISEYVEGSSNNKYLEIFNGTGNEVNLANYRLRLYSNGSTSTTSDILLSGLLPNGSCAVYKNSSAVLSLPAGVLAVNNNACNFNGNDAVALYKISPTGNVDIFGRIGEDPGSAWGTAPLTTVDKTLRRKSSVLSGIATNPASGFPTLATQWDSYPQNTADGLGSHSIGGISYLSGYQDVSVSPVLARVSGLDPNSSYSYVVRAVNAGGTTENSNVIEVSTTGISSGTGANTSIAGSSTTVLLPTLAGFTNNDLVLDPVSETNDDYAVFASPIAGGIRFSISSSANEALNGNYILNHAGLGYAPQSVQYTLGGNTFIASSFTSTDSQTELSISGLSKLGKGTLNIDLLQEETLPVELSAFTAVINSQYNVSIQWISQSESGMHGYYVLRSTQDNLTQAEVISPLIGATNTSQPQLYLFEDRELDEDGSYYYWLQNLDLNGVSGFYGPISLSYVLPEGGSSTPPLITDFTSSYPNPFSDDLKLGYSLARPASLSFEIFNLRGQKVRSIPVHNQSKGLHSLSWNGRDQNNGICATGLYYIRMQVESESFIRKVMLVK